MTWPEDPSRLIADAYAIHGAKGVPLLLSMGSFDLWRGSLPQMRGDLPTAVVSVETDVPNAEQFLQTLAVSRALEAIPPRGAEILRLAYVENASIQEVADAIETSSRYAAKLLESYTTRLLAVAEAIYQALSSAGVNENSLGTPSIIGRGHDDETAAEPRIPSRSDYDETPAEHK